MKAVICSAIGFWLAAGLAAGVEVAAGVYTEGVCSATAGKWDVACLAAC